MSSGLAYFNVEMPLTDDHKLVKMAEEILAKLKPNWLLKNISFKFFTAGITNKILCATYPTMNGAKTSERVLFRVFGRNTEKIIDRKAELDNWLRLAEMGCAAPLYATFLNGIISGFLEGKPLTVEDVRNDKIVTEICKSMATIHRLEPRDHRTVRTVLFDKGEKFLNAFSKKFDDSQKQKQFDEYFTQNAISLKDDFNTLQKLIGTLKTRIVFCHNDLLVHNIIYDSKTGKISFIDYEYAGFNYQGFDIANHFCEYAGVENVNYSLCPSTEQKRAWISQYLRFFHQRPISTNDIEEMLQNNEIFEAAAHYFWAVWALVQSQNSIIEFDYLGYGILRYKMFQSIMRSYRQTNTYRSAENFEHSNMLETTAPSLHNDHIIVTDCA